MSKDDLILLEEVSGTAQAEALRGLMRAQGIEVLLSQEAAGSSTFPVTFGTLGNVQILVREEDIEQAREILDEYYSGKFMEQEIPEDNGDQ